MKPRYALVAILVATAVSAALIVTSLRTHVARADDAPKQIAYLGATLVNAGPEACRKAGTKGGAQIVAIDPDSPADKEGLLEGDIITTFESQPVTAAYQVYGKIRRMHVGELASIHYWREGYGNRVALLVLGGIEYGDAGPGAGPDSRLADRLERLEREVASLHRRVEVLERAQER